MPPKKEEAKPAAAAQKKEVPKAAAKTAPVPETLLKKRKSKSEVAAKVIKQRTSHKKRLAKTRRVIFKRAENYVREYKKQERFLIHARRQAKQGGNFFADPESKIAFVIRIRGITGLHPKPRKILQLLRLRQINNGVFVRLSNATKKMLTLIEPYIAYGYPNLKTVKELIYKRGFGKVNKQRIPLTNNQIIEQTLGKLNILCTEDLIHEIFTCGPNFKKANRFLWPFKLAPPTGGWNRVLNHYVEGGDFGNREDKINALVRRMN